MKSLISGRILTLAIDSTDARSIHTAKISIRLLVSSKFIVSSHRTYSDIVAIRDSAKDTVSMLGILKTLNFATVLSNRAIPNAITSNFTDIATTEIARSANDKVIAVPQGKNNVPNKVMNMVNLSIEAISIIAKPLPEYSISMPLCTIVNSRCEIGRAHV